MTPIKKEIFEQDAAELDSKIVKEKATLHQLKIKLEHFKSVADAKSSTENEAVRQLEVIQAKQEELSRIKLAQDAAREEIAWRDGHNKPSA